MKQFLEEFKAFAVKGNVVDLATAVVIGTAFGAIVSSLVANVVMPLIGILLGGIDFSGLKFVIGESEITYGIFVQSVINFLIISMVVFLAIKLIAQLQRKEEVKQEEKPKELSDEAKLLIEIRDLLKR